MKYLYCGLLILCLLLGACWLSGREIGRRSEAVALRQRLLSTMSSRASTAARRAFMWGTRMSRQWKDMETALSSSLSFSTSLLSTFSSR